MTMTLPVSPMVQIHYQPGSLAKEGEGEEAGSIAASFLPLSLDPAVLTKAK